MVAENNENKLPPVADAPLAPSAEAKRERRGRGWLVVIAAGLVLVLAVVFGYRWVTADDVSTDDAMVDAEVVPLSVQVGGQVARVAIADNTRVKKGDVILEIDTVELQAKLAQAQADLEAAEAQADLADAQEQLAGAGAKGSLTAAEAGLTSSRAGVSTAAANLARAEADVVTAEAEAKRAAGDLERAKNLLAGGAITQQGFDNVNAQAAAAQSRLEAARAAAASAREMRKTAESAVIQAGANVEINAPVDAKLAIARANADTAHARVISATAALDLAQLDLDHATVKAPADGVVSKLGVRAGQVLSPGAQIAYLVPDTSYIVANFKETQIGDMKPGQPVDIEIDSYPGHDFTGVVESLSAGTGSRFSLLQPDNASGNFVKVVQRVPVRIKRTDTDADYVLRPGQSAVVTVHTN